MPMLLSVVFVKVKKCFFQVLTRIMTSSKPTIQLSEVMTMQDVEKLLILACGGEYNSGQKLWGGAWTSHIIICFLQDILEGGQTFFITFLIS